MGQFWSVVYLHFEPVMIFAVPLFLHFLIEETQDLMGKCLPTLRIAHIMKREKMYTIKLSSQSLKSQSPKSQSQDTTRNNSRKLWRQS